MQFKKVGKRIQVLVYRGYDKEKKRSIIKMLGSLDRYTYEPTDGLINSLTEDEKIELQSYIEKERQYGEKILIQYDIDNSVCHIKKITDALKSGDFEFSEEWADEMWTALNSLNQAMRKAGFKRSQKKPVKGPESSLSVQAMFDIENIKKIP